MTKKFLSIVLVLCTLLSFTAVYANAAATNVRLNKTSGTVSVGSTENLNATVLPAGSSQTVEWTSSNTSVATVVDGVVTVLDCSGTAEIKATVPGTSISATYTLTATHNFTGEDRTNPANKVCDATCTQYETWKYTCTCCGIASDNDADTYPIGDYAKHDMQKIADYVAPTCKDYGRTQENQCTVCLQKEGGEQIAKLTTHTDDNNDDYCDVCNKYLGEVVIDSTFKCSMCPTYEAKKDIPFIGVIYEIVHFFVHMIENINKLT